VLYLVLIVNKLLATIGLGITLLFSQGANVLVAALCPHLRSPAEESCVSHLPEPDAHHHMNHMEMDSHEGEFVTSESTDPKETAQSVFISQPTGLCPHCAMHTRLSSKAITFRETKVTNRAGDLKLALIIDPIVFEHKSVVSIPSSRAHGPPGEKPPRHVLINVFRI